MEDEALFDQVLLRKQLHFVRKFVAIFTIATLLVPYQLVFAQEVGVESQDPPPVQATSSEQQVTVESQQGEALSEGTGTNSNLEESGQMLEEGSVSLPDGGGEMSLLSGGEDPSPTIDAPNLFTYNSAAPKVEQSGALSHEIQLSIPPGRNNLTPSLSLFYNSQDLADGMVGYGWSLSIPYIERINKTGSERLYTDNYFSSSFGGELIASTSEEYVHRFEEGDFIRYTFEDDIWTAYDKNGTRYLFGSTTQAQQSATTSPDRISRWMLEEVRDVNDNFIRYEYTKDGNQIYPSQITYTGHGSTDGIFEIDFTYETRPDIFTSYKTAYRVDTAKRLTQILASVDGSWVRKYTLSYTVGVNDARSLLLSVQETGRDENASELSLPAITFGYSSSTPQYVNGTNPRIWNNSRIPADVDGNGLPDRAVFWSNGTTSEATRDIDENEYPSFPDYSQATTSEFWSYYNEGASGSNEYPTLERGTRFFDVNGDGRADILKGLRESTGNIIHEYYESIAPFVWSATAIAGTPPVFACANESESVSTGIFGNLNGDGLTDYVASTTACTIVSGAYLNGGTENGWEFTTSFSPKAPMATSTTDVNASQFVDINGDGLDDWMYSTSSATSFYLNTGSGWATTSDSRWTIGTAVRQSGAWDKGIRFVDWNGDGLTDYIRAYTMPSYSTKAGGVSDIETGTYNYVYLNTGNGFVSSSLTIPEYIFNGVVNSGNWAGQVDYNELVDWNGDGILDSAGKTSTSTATVLPDILIEITYPTGGQTNVTHKQSSQLASANPELPYPILVVTEVVNEDSFNDNQITSYTYEGGQLYFEDDVRDRRFAGFERITEQNTLGSIRSYFHQGNASTTATGEQIEGFSLIGKKYREDAISVASTTLKKLFTGWDVEEYSQTSTSSANTHSTSLIKTDNQYWSITDASQTGLDLGSTFTLSAWVKVSTAPTQFLDYILFSKDRTDQRSLDVYYGPYNSNKTISAYVFNINNSAHTRVYWTADLGTDTWHHIALTWDGSQSGASNKWKLYVDGVQNTSVTDSADAGGGVTAPANGTAPFEIAGSDLNQSTGSSAQHGWNGKIDDARVWNRVLSGGEISSLYSDSEDFSNGSNFTAWWKYNNTGNDSSGNSNTLSNYNLAAFSSDTAFSGTATTTSVTRWFSRAGSEMTQDFSESGAHKDQAVEYTYATTTGDLTQVVRKGEVTGNSDGTYVDTGSDTITKDITYVGSSTVNMRVATQETVKDNAGTTVKDSKFYYDNLSFGSVGKGNLTGREDWISGSDWASTTKVYSTYGLVASSTDANGNITSYTHDSRNLYVATTTNALGHTMGYTYDYATGETKNIFDANSRLQQFIYDPVGRLTEKKIPDPSSGTSVTHSTITYTDDVSPRKRQETRFLNSATSTDMYIYLDGFGRVIQERTELDASTFTVRDKVYGSSGLLKKESYPYSSASSAYASSTTDADLYTSYGYDILRRATSTTNAVGTETYTYDGWRKRVTDRNGNPKDFHTDAHGNLINVVEFLSTLPATTTYNYDPLNNLTKITDSMGNIRHFFYDGLSRATSTQDLHDPADSTFGTWTYTYDDAGNLTSYTDPKSQTVNKTYDALNRAITEDFTGAGGTEMQYGYDSCTDGKGKLCSATTTNVVTYLTYNPLGLVASEEKTIDSAEYTTSFTYDRLGSIANITYPDNSIVRYDYDSAGQLETVARKPANSSTYLTAVSDIDYAPTGAISYKELGNGIMSTYTYDDNALYRLINILTVASSTWEGGGTLALMGGPGGVAPWQASLALASPQLLAVALLENPELLELALEEASAPVEVPEEVFETEEIIEEVEQEEKVIEEVEPAPASTSTEGAVLGTTTSETVDVTEGSSASSTPAQEQSQGVSTSTATSSSQNTEVIEIELATTTIELATSTEATTTPETLATSTEEKVNIHHDTITETPPASGSIRELLQGKGLHKRANIKGEQIARYMENKRGQRVSRDGYDIDIISVAPIEGGVQAFVRAWHADGTQVGFGEDGTVDIERFRIFNPPILVPDEKGDITQEWTVEDPVTGEKQTRSRTLREDPEEALLQVIEHNLSVMKNVHGDENIVRGKRGNTVSTFYPSLDGRVGRRSVDESWSTIRAGAGNDLRLGNTTNESGLILTSTTNNQFAGLDRSFFYFNTASIPDGDTISSATLSLYGPFKNDTLTLSPKIDANIYSADTGSNTELVTSDFQTVGSTPYSTAIYYDSWNDSGYNDFSLNSDGRAYIDKTSVTVFSTRGDYYDEGGNTPSWTSGLITYLQHYMDDQTGTSQDPKLVVEHSEFIPEAGDTLQDISYTYDAVGNITRVENESENDAAHDTTYTYDTLHRLTLSSTTAASTTISTPFIYNILGNLLTQGSNATSSTANTHATDLERDSSQYWSIADASQTGLDLTSTMTLTMWVKTESQPPSDESFVLASKDGSPTDRGFVAYYSDNAGTKQLSFYTFDQANTKHTRIYCDQTLTAGTWYHLAFTWDGSQSGATNKIKCYVNGSSLTPSSSAEAGGGITAMDNNTASVRVGGIDAFSSTRLFDGLIDDVRIFSRTFSASDVSLLHASPSHFTTDTNLEALWQFDNTGNDATTNANHLTGNNSPTFTTNVAYDSAPVLAHFTYSTSTGYQNPHAPIAYFDGSATTTFSYDNNGNLTEAGSPSATTTYSWDYRNRLGTTTTGIATTTYSYDHNNDRVKKTIDGTTTHYPNKYFDKTGATTTAYIYLPNGELIATVEGNGTATTTSYIHTDHLGSTNIVTDEDGEVTQTLDYYPYGGQRINEGADAADRQYIGQFYDAESELQYLNARYYEGSRGQFLSQDPTHFAIGDPRRVRAVTGFTQDYFLNDPQLLNSYAYGRSNPIRYSDPNGNCPWCLPFLAGGAIGGIGLYASDVMQNRAEGLTGWDAYAPRSSWQEYNTAVVFGAGTAATAVYSLAGAAVISIVGSGIQDLAGEREIDPEKALLTGGVTVVTGGVFKGLAGPSPAINTGGKSVTSNLLTNQLRYTVVGETFQGSVNSIVQSNYQTRNTTPMQSYNSGSGSGGNSLGSLLNSLSRALSALSKALGSQKTK